MQTRFKFLNSLDIEPEVQRRLSILLSRVIKGDDQVIRTPFMKETQPEKILENWDKIFHSNNLKINEPLEQLENLNRSKFGPRSIAVPWVDRKEGLYSYFKGEQKDCRSLFTDNPVIRKQLSPGLLRPLSINNAVEYLKNSTNSGLPFYVRKGLVKDRVLASFPELLKREDPCVLFTRTQESKKTRSVWGFPIADTLNEMRYYRPLLEYQKKLSWRSAIVGPEQVDKSITLLMDNAKRDKLQLVSVDFSAYDTLIKSNLQKESFEYISYLFQSSNVEDLLYIQYRFGNIGIITPDGVIDGPHGVPSGSTFTNEVDSIAQYLVAERSGVVARENMQIQGDDGAYATSEPDALIDAFESKGLVVNKEKSYVSDNYLVYLQMLYSNDYRQANGIIGGVYPTYRALNRLVFQERFDDFTEYDIVGRDYYAIRAISILENCKHHPYFKELVLFVKQNNKYSLLPSPESVVKYIKMLNDKSGKVGLIANQYGEDLKGIRSFATYKLLSA